MVKVRKLPISLSNHTLKLLATLVYEKLRFFYKISSLKIDEVVLHIQQLFGRWFSDYGSDIQIRASFFPANKVPCFTFTG